jgi:hypothetical protein
LYQLKSNCCMSSLDQHCPAVCTCVGRGRGRPPPPPPPPPPDRDELVCSNLIHDDISIAISNEYIICKPYVTACACQFVLRYVYRHILIKKGANKNNEVCLYFVAHQFLYLGCIKITGVIRTIAKSLFVRKPGNL